MNAIQILCEGTMNASVLILEKKGFDLKKVDSAKLSEDLRKTLKEEINNVLGEWQDAVEANLNELWLREFVNAQCNEIALKALKEGGWL